MRRIGSFLIFLILVFFYISISFSNDYVIKVEIAGNNRISLYYITKLQINILIKKLQMRKSI